MKFFIRFSIFSLLLVTTSIAKITPAGGLASEFALGFHATTLGSGGGGIGLFASPGSALINPALLSTLQYQEVSLTVTTLANQSYLANAFWVHPISDNQGVSVSISGLSTGEIDRVIDYAPAGNFQYSTTLATFSFGRRFGAPVYLGGSLHILNQSLDQFSDYGIGFDLGAAARLHRYFTLGANALNIIEPEVQLNQIAEVQKRSFGVGFALPSIPVTPRFWLTGQGSVEWFDGYAGRYFGGISADIDSLFSLRAGYQAEKLTFGLGVRNKGFTIDYALQLVDVISDHHSVSITFAIGSSLQDRLQRRELERQAAQIEAERRRRYEQNRILGKEFFDRFELDSALVYYQRALAFDETNQELIGSISSIQSAIATKRETDIAIAETMAETRQQIRTYYDQSNLLYERGSYRAAQELLNLLIEIQPDNAQALDLGSSIQAAIDSVVKADLMSADSSLAQGRSVDAISTYNRILDLDPKNARAISGKETAIARLDKAVQLNLAIEAFNKGLLDDAERRFRAVLEASPGGETTASDYIARIASLRQRPADAGIVPAIPVTLDQLQQDRATWGLYVEGLKLMRDRQYDEAIRLWQQVLAVYPNQTNTLENIKQARLRIQSDSGSNK